MYFILTLMCYFYSCCYGVEAEHVFNFNTMEYGPVSNQETFNINEDEGFRFSIKPAPYSRILKIKTNVDVKMQIHSTTKITEEKCTDPIFLSTSRSNSTSSGSEPSSNDSFTTQNSPKKGAFRFSPACRAALLACAQKDRSYIFKSCQEAECKIKNEKLIFSPKRCIVTHESIVQYQIKPYVSLFFEPIISKKCKTEFGPISLERL